MTRFAIEIGDRIARDGDEFRFDGRRNDKLDFLSAKTGARLELSDLDLAEGVASRALRMIQRSASNNATQETTGHSTPSPEFAELPEERKAQALRRLAYLKGIERRGIDLLSATALREALPEIAVELGDTRPPHLTTIWRWRKRAGNKPTAPLLVNRDEAKGNRRDRLGPEVREIIGTSIDSRYLKPERMPVSELHEHVEAEISLANETRTEKLRCPSYEAVKAAVRALDRRDVMEARHGKAAADRRFDPARRQKDPEAPLDLVEIDHTKADMFVIDGATLLPIGRPWITLAMDRCTRMPFGVYIGFEPPSVHSVMQCLRNGMLPKTYVGRLATESGMGVKHAWPVCGRPRKLVTDRGMEFVGRDLEDFAACAGIDILVTPRKKPWYKGAIERYLGALNRRLLQRQRGSTFGNVLERGEYDPVRNAVVSFDTLQVIVHRWLLDVYACHGHRGSGDVPMRAWDELTRRFPVSPIADLAELDTLFGRVEQRRLGRTGVAFEGIQYISDELVAWLQDPEFRRLSPKRDVKVRYDPSDLGEVRIRDPRTGRYLCVPPGPRDQEYAQGLSIWQHKQIVRYQRERMAGAEDRECRARARKEIADQVEAAWADRKRSVRTRQRLARQVGIGRRAMAGDDTSTGPATQTPVQAPAPMGPVIDGWAEELSPAPPPSATPIAGGRRDPAPRPSGPARRGGKTSGGVTLRRLTEQVSQQRCRDGEEEDVYADLGIRRTEGPKGDR